MNARGDQVCALAEQIVREMASEKLTLAVAESLTGGDVCARLVDIAGASVVLRGGVVAYATDLKHTLLGVDLGLLEAGGPVQAPVAAQMARGVASLCGADVGVSTTGVAGPGDSPDGPEGLVYVGVFGLGRARTSRRHLAGTRDQIRAQSVEAVLALLEEELQGRTRLSSL